MTLTSEDSRDEYTTSGSDTTFAVSFAFWDLDDPLLTLREADGTETAWVRGTQYTMAGGSGSTGTATIITSPTDYTPAADLTLVITSNLDNTQNTDLPAGGAFPSSEVEQQLDQIVRMIQQGAEEDGRRLHFPITDLESLSSVIPGSAIRANTVLAFDVNGEVVTSTALGTWRGNWAASRAYVIRDLIKDTSNSNVYVCNTDHTSSGSQPISGNTDVAKWDLVIDAAAAAASAAAALVSANNAAASETATGADVVLTHADVVLTHADVGLTHADVVLTNADVVLAENSKAAAATSATASANSATASASSATASASSATASASSATASAASAESRLNGVKFAFETTTTDTDQGAGKVWLNNGTPSSASVLYVDDVEAGGVSVNAWVDTWDDVSNAVARGYIYIASYGSTNAILVYKITGAVTSASTYSKVAVTHILTVGTLSDGDSIGLTFVPSGSDGEGSGDLEASNNLSDVASAAPAFGNLKQAASTTATGVVEIATDAETNTGSATDKVITPANLTQRAMLQGLHSMWIPAGSMIPQITNGPSSGLFESSSNDIMSRTLDFNTSTDELAQFTVVMPKSWNEGTVTFRAYWTAASGSGTVLWSYAGGSFADSRALDTALGSEAVTAADTLLTALDVHVSAVSAACTIANSPAAGGLVIIRVRRDVSGDNLGVDAKLLGVQMFYTADAGNDA